MGEVILDVRERDEYEAEHVAHSINVPLSHFAVVAPGVLNQLRERNVVVMCRSGARARMALQQIGGLGYADKVSAKVYDGGILEWKKQGRPTIARRGNHIPLMRQTQLVSGLGVLLFTILGHYVSSTYLFWAGFFGAGLAVAGATGFCGMANLLALMPWNRTEPSTEEELNQISPIHPAGGNN